MIILCFLLIHFGSLYSVNIDNFRINWFVNINETINSNPGSLFDGSKILIYENKLILFPLQNLLIY